MMNQESASHYCRLLEAKQELEKDCTKLQSMVCELELAVSDASKEVAHVTDIQQHTLDTERYYCMYSCNTPQYYAPL